MSDIFISYASEDKTRVEALARALERKGWSVWWDRRILTGQSFDEVIQEALEVSKAVVVVWTQVSVKSQWVKNESREGLNRRALFPVMLEDVKIPLEFRHVQAARLIDWQLDQDHAGFEQFIDDLTQVIGAPSNTGIESAPLKKIEEWVSSSTSPSPEPENEPRCERTLGVRPELERRETESSFVEVGAGNSNLPREQESEKADEDRSSNSTQSLPYIPFGIGVFAAIGVLAYIVVFPQGPSPGKKTEMQPQPALQLPSSRNGVITPPLVPEQDKNILKDLVSAVVPKPRVQLGGGPIKIITGKDGAPMVLVLAGEFTMGSREVGTDGDMDEHPAHQVYLDTYFIDQYEVTTARYATFLQESKRIAPAHWSEQVLNRHGSKPVVGVDWNDAVAYCVWAGKRLPTESEWEKAARGTDQRLYPWGNEAPNEQRANRIEREYKNGYEALTAVGSFEQGKSPYGAYDMVGNVWEWVADWYDKNYYGKSPARNPTGPSGGESRVFRGGSWLTGPAGYVRSTTRLQGTPTTRDEYSGFRCVQDIPK